MLKTPSAPSDLGRREATGPGHSIKVINKGLLKRDWGKSGQKGRVGAAAAGGLRHAEGEGALVWPQDPTLPTWAGGRERAATFSRTLTGVNLQPPEGQGDLRIPKNPAQRARPEPSLGDSGWLYPLRGRWEWISTPHKGYRSPATVVPQALTILPTRGSSLLMQMMAVERRVPASGTQLLAG